MSVKLKIKVTKEILEKSKYCGNNGKSVSENCAIALAVRDIFPHAVVTPNWINIFGDSILSTCEIKNIPLPLEVTMFIGKFDELKHSPDKRLELPELEFEIDIPQEVVDTINIEEIKSLLINHPTLELV